MDRDVLRELWSALAHAGVEYVTVGGVALNLHGLVRATEDVDLFVLPDPDNVARLRAALRARFEDPSIDDIRAEDLAGDYPVVRYVPPGGAAPIDIVSRLGSAFAYQDIDAETMDVDGVEVRVATPHSLYAMKRDTMRPRDRDDAERLREAFGLGGEGADAGDAAPPHASPREEEEG